MGDAWLKGRANRPLCEIADAPESLHALWRAVWQALWCETPSTVEAPRISSMGLLSTGCVLLLDRDEEAESEERSLSLRSDEERSLEVLDPGLRQPRAVRSTACSQCVGVERIKWRVKVGWVRVRLGGGWRGGARSAIPRHTALGPPAPRDRAAPI